MAEQNRKDGMEYYILRIKEGKVVTVNADLRLRVAESQAPTPSVLIKYRYVNGRTHIAFRFLYEEKQHLIKVENNSLKLVEDNTSVQSDEHWFEMMNLGGGEHYCLKSVVNSRYVSMSKGRESFLELSPTEEYIQVTATRS